MTVNERRPGVETGAASDLRATNLESTSSVLEVADNVRFSRAELRRRRVRPHGSACTWRCRELSIPSPLDRDRPPFVPCPHCGAAAGVACTVVGPYRKPLSRFGRFHPSRLAVAA